MSKKINNKDCKRFRTTKFSYYNCNGSCIAYGKIKFTQGNVFSVLKNGFGIIIFLSLLGFNITLAILNEEPEHIFPLVNVCI